MKNFSLLLLCSFLLFSCASPAGETTEEVISDTGEESALPVESSSELYADLFMPGSGGVFRGFTFDMSKKQVKEIETSRANITILQDEEPTELTVTSNMGNDVLNFADITYSFDDKGLFSIKVETYASDKTLAKEVFDMLIANYTSKYGEANVAEDGFYEFLVPGNDYKYKIAAKSIDDLEGSFGMYIYYYLDVEAEEEAI